MELKSVIYAYRLLVWLGMVTKRWIHVQGGQIRIKRAFKGMKYNAHPQLFSLPDCYFVLNFHQFFQSPAYKLLHFPQDIIENRVLPLPLVSHLSSYFCKRVCPSVYLSVRPSVCPSVCLSNCLQFRKTAENSNSSL